MKKPTIPVRTPTPTYIPIPFDELVANTANKLAIYESTIRECIALLQISGEGTKRAVIEKLRGLGE